MSVQITPQALNRIPLSTVRRWAVKAAIAGFATGIVVATIALQLP